MSRGVSSFYFIFVSILVSILFFVVTFTSADGDVSVQAHTPVVTLTPGFATCTAIPSQFTVHVENTNLNNFGIYNVKIYKAPANIASISCGSAPSGWTFTGFQFGLYCEYVTDPQGNFTINQGEPGLDFTFDATINQSNCVSSFKITTLDNEAILTGQGEGAEVNTIKNLTVDCSAPKINKTVGQPKIVCEENGCHWWITQDTIIDFLAYDNQDKCDVGLDYCQWDVYIDGEFSKTYSNKDNANQAIKEWSLQFGEDSEHEINVICKDLAGNEVELNELDKVDSTPPTILKTLNGPYSGQCLPRPNSDDKCYVDSATSILIQAEDGGDICAIDNVQCRWRYRIARDFNQSFGEWNEWNYSSVVTFPEESIHELAIECNDSLGNTATDVERFIVDKTPPVLNKMVKYPRYGQCPPQSGNMSSLCFVTNHTDIKLECEDGWNGNSPHPSGNETIYWRYRFTENGIDWNPWNPWTAWNNGFSAPIQVQWDTIRKINFPESSLHELEFYCKDAVNKTTPVDVEYFRVDNEPPVIAKTMFGSWLGQCPPRPGTSDKCYVADNGLSGVKVNITDPNPIHASGVESCTYKVFWNSPQGVVQVGKTITTYDPYFTVIFTEDSTHTLNITCQDNVGNMIVDNEIFLVDSTPPVTVKNYGNPFFSCTDWAEEVCEYEGVGDCVSNFINQNCGGYDLQGGDAYPHWINSETQVRLNASDNKVGVDKIFWRNHVIENPEGWSLCREAKQCHPESYSQWINNSLPWNIVSGNSTIFNKPGESCHVIEYYSVDKLNNTEDLKWQCVFVDNSPPVTTKVVGDPRVECNFQGTCDSESDGRTYTIDIDFDEGTLNGLNHNPNHDQLQLNIGKVTTFPVMWVANAGESSVSKWDTSTNKELARYHTWFGPLTNNDPWSGPAPSRTAVDSDGNVYVANRHFDNKPADVFKILSNDWIDRNGNGIMDTSFDNNSDGTIQVGEMATQMTDSNFNGKIDPNELTDERVAWVTSVGPSDCLGRSVAIDLSGNIWLGCYNKRTYYKLDGNNGTILAGPINVAPNTPYGALVDKYGILWGASLDGQLLRLDTTNNNVTNYPHNGGDYGIALGYDSSGYTHVYLGSYSGDTYYEFNSATNTFSTPAALHYGSEGLATDQQGNIVVGNAGTGGVAKFYPNGSLIWNAVPQVGGDARGTVVDSEGNVWVIYVNSNNMAKYNGTNGAHLGVFNTGKGPYTYSDAAGLGFAGSVSAGTWNVIYDSGSVNTTLGPVSWNANIPENTSLTVRVRSSDDKVSWSPWEVVSTGVAFASTPAARYLEVEVSMKSTSGNSPILYDLNIGGGCGEQPQCWYVNQNTPISLTCNDPEPHPVDHSSLWYRFRYANDCNALDNSVWSNWTDPKGEIEKIFNFKEDSCHELEYYCVDALGNEEETQREIDIVDSQPPIINKTIVGPWSGTCPPLPINGIHENGVNPQVVLPEQEQCYLDGVTKIHVEVTDPQPHPVNDVRCTWDYEVFGGQKNGTGQTNITAPFDINFPEESYHDLTITCWDALGNTVVDRELFTVDKTPPVTTKSYKGALVVNNSGAEWINNLTQIWLSAYDSEPHPSGVNVTYYRNTLVDEMYCQNQDICQQAEGSGSWETWNGTPKYKNEQSCHLIEYYSVDNVNKTEHVKKQCAFVDLTAPEPNKTVGESKSLWTPGKNGHPLSVFYPNETKNCWSDNANTIDCWKVTLDTPITLDCKDPQPHPVQGEKVYFQVDFDGDDITQQYCNQEGVEGSMQENGYCFVSGTEAPFTFYFTEESEHNLKFYCEDALGNIGKIDEEKFKVEGRVFKIHIDKKWNLISVPFVLTDNNITRVFESIAENIEAVWTYNAKNGTAGEWLVYRPGNESTSTLFEIHPGHGYWILAKNEDELIMGGSLFSPGAVTPPARELEPGWNLIGYYGNEDQYGNRDSSYSCSEYDGKMALCALNSLVEPVGLGNPRWSALEGYCEKNNPPNPWEGYNYDDNMAPGAGYWIFMKTSAANPEEDYLYGPSTTCGLFI